MKRWSVLLYAIAIAIVLSAGMTVRHYDVTATTTSQTQRLGVVGKSLSVQNTGANTAYINLTTAGPATTTGFRDVPIDPGQSPTFTAPAGETIEEVHYITSTGTSTLRFIVTR